MSTTLSSATADAPRVVFDDPHGNLGNMQEAEVTRVRSLTDSGAGP